MPHSKGQCPKCGQAITSARCLEANTLRRNVLECPNCQARILKCRMPGCRDYALGGRVWDNEFCPDCTKTVAILGIAALVLGRLDQPRRPWPPYLR